MNEALLAGLLLGLTAGLAPGPMLALTIAQSLRYGPRAGLRVAVAPLLTDLPIIAVALLALGEIAQKRPLLGAIALVGGVYLVYLAWETWHGSVAAPDRAPPSADGLRRALLTNFLNPHPYLFWAVVGGPLLLHAWSGAGLEAALAFVAVFYAMLVGAKAGLAVLAGRYRGLLRGHAYRYVLRALAVGLALLALALLWDGLGLCGVR